MVCDRLLIIKRKYFDLLHFGSQDFHGVEPRTAQLKMSSADFISPKDDPNYTTVFVYDLTLDEEAKRLSQIEYFWTVNPSNTQKVLIGVTSVDDLVQKLTSYNRLVANCYFLLHGMSNSDLTVGRTSIPVQKLTMNTARSFFFNHTTPKLQMRWIQCGSINVPGLGGDATFERIFGSHTTENGSFVKYDGMKRVWTSKTANIDIGGGRWVHSGLNPEYLLQDKKFVKHYYQELKDYYYVSGRTLYSRENLLLC